MRFIKGWGSGRKGRNQNEAHRVIARNPELCFFARFPSNEKKKNEFPALSKKKILVYGTDSTAWCLMLCKHDFLKSLFPLIETPPFRRNFIQESLLNLHRWHGKRKWEHRSLMNSERFFIFLFLRFVQARDCHNLLCCEKRWEIFMRAKV